jgi:ABC-type sugar transport system substrate-binding protein
MKTGKMVFIVLIGLCLAAPGFGTPKKYPAKKRILVVSSYNREYTWSQDTNRGFCDAMLKLGYFDNKEQVEEFTKNDLVRLNWRALRQT